MNIIIVCWAHTVVSKDVIKVRLGFSNISYSSELLKDLEAIEKSSSLLGTPVPGINVMLTSPGTWSSA